MEAVLKIAECLVPLIIDLIKLKHPEKSSDEHREIAHQIINDHLNKKEVTNAAN